MAEFEPLNPKKLPHLNHPICEKMPGKYERIGREIGKLVDKKNRAYGDAFNKSDEFLKLLTIFLGMQDELMDTREQLVRKDYELQNALDKLKQLESVERQNKRLKAIIAEEWKEMTG